MERCSELCGPAAPSSPAHPVEAPPQIVAQDNARQTWCQLVAGSDVIKAQSDGFTVDTVKHMAMISYNQCMMMAGAGR